MYLNEALKTIRLEQGVSQEQWIRFCDLSLSHYSEFESGKIRNGRRVMLTAEQVLTILLINGVSTSVIHQMTANTYLERLVESRLSHLSSEDLIHIITAAYVEKDLDLAKQIQLELINTGKNQDVLLYTQLVLGEMTGELKTVSLAQLKHAISYVFKSKRWTKNVQILAMIGVSMPHLEQDLQDKIIHQLIVELRDMPIKRYTREQNISLAIIFIRYLIANQGQANREDCINFLHQLPANTDYVLYKLTTSYLEDYFNGKHTSIAHAKERFIAMGYTSWARIFPD